MESNRKTRVAYRCAVCGSVISADISPETLSSPFKLPCVECSKSVLEISRTPDGSINLLVPCLMCPHSHPFKISEKMFFERDIITLPCSFTGLDICFIGEEDLVEDEIDASGALLSEITDDEDADCAEGKKNAQMMSADTSVMREVLFAVAKLDEEKKITCTCGSRSVKVILGYDSVSIVCKVCARHTELAARTRFDANRAIDLDAIFIS